MAVLWRSMENAGVIDARYREDSDSSPGMRGKIAEKNTFLEKHLRILDPLPAEGEMKSIVKKLYESRQKGKNTKVKSVAGPSDKTKQQLFGGLKPGANTTLFIGSGGFQETNAWIEKNVSSSNSHVEVPIFGNGTVVTYDGTSNTFHVAKTGKLKLSVAVGNAAQFENSRGSAVSMKSKVVYHFGGVV